MKRVWIWMWVLGIAIGTAQQEYPQKWEVHRITWSSPYCFFNNDTTFFDSLYVYRGRLLEVPADIEAWDERRFLFATNRCPHVALTTDYGNSWKRILEFPTQPYMEYHIVDVEWATAKTIYVLIDTTSVKDGRTSRILLRSRDEGESFEVLPIWTRAMTEQKGWQYRPVDISFADSLHGIMIGFPVGRGADGPTLWYTTDGGRTWDTVDTFRGVEIMTGVDASDLYDSDYIKAFAPGYWVIFASDHKVYKTTDWGQHWSVVNWGEQIPKCKQPGCAFGEVEFVTDQTWFVAISWEQRSNVLNTGAAVLRTTDGGKTFELVLDSLPPVDPRGYERPFMNPLQSVCFADTLYGFAMGYSGAIWKTTDGGEHWELEDADILEPDYYSFYNLVLAECECPARGKVMASSFYRWLRYNERGILPMPEWVVFPKEDLPFVMVTHRPFELRWKQVPGASRYRLRIVKGLWPAGIEVWLDTLVRDTAVVVDFDENKELYYTYLRAENDEVKSNWRETRIKAYYEATAVEEDRPKVQGRRMTLVRSNPGNGRVQMVFPWSGQWRVELIGQLGKRLEQVSVGYRRAWEEVTLDFSAYPSGFYLLYCSSPEGWWVEPLVIVK